MGLPAPLGFYIHKSKDFAAASFNSQLVNARKSHVIPLAKPPHQLVYHPAHGYHFENGKIVDFLKKEAVERGIKVKDETVRDIELHPDSGEIIKIIFESGGSASADLFIDCTGFRSFFLGKIYKTQFNDYSNTLFCDRAVVGWYPRARSEMIPCTLLQKMDAGWMWRTDHPDITARGYVFYSSHINNNQAIDEFSKKLGHPINDMRVVRFRTGTYSKSWVKNVVAIGNSFSFIEPMEATALHHIEQLARLLTEIVAVSQESPPVSAVNAFNDTATGFALSVRAFIEAHYKFGHGTGSKFWQDCNNIEMQDIAKAAYDWYSNVGPIVSNGPISDSIFGKNDIFRWEGYFSTFMGCQAPTKWENPITDLTPYLQYKARQATAVNVALPIEDAVDHVQNSKW